MGAAGYARTLAQYGAVGQAIELEPEFQAEVASQGQGVYIALGLTVVAIAVINQAVAGGQFERAVCLARQLTEGGTAVGQRQLAGLAMHAVAPVGVAVVITVPLPGVQAELLLLDIAQTVAVGIVLGVRLVAKSAGDKRIGAGQILVVVRQAVAVIVAVLTVNSAALIQQAAEVLQLPAVRYAVVVLVGVALKGSVSGVHHFCIAHQGGGIGPAAEPVAGVGLLAVGCLLLVGAILALCGDVVKAVVGHQTGFSAGQNHGLVAVDVSGAAQAAPNANIVQSTLKALAHPSADQTRAGGDRQAGGKLGGDIFAVDIQRHGGTAAVIAHGHMGPLANVDRIRGAKLLLVAVLVGEKHLQLAPVHQAQAVVE